MTEYPYRRFLLFSAIGGTAWAIYTCVLAYLVSTALADLALASIVISGLITSALVGGVYTGVEVEASSSMGSSGAPDAPCVRPVAEVDSGFPSSSTPAPARARAVAVATAAARPGRRSN